MGLRLDGRKPDELRRIAIQLSTCNQQMRHQNIVALQSFKLGELKSMHISMDPSNCSTKPKINLQKSL